MFANESPMALLNGRVKSTEGQFLSLIGSSPAFRLSISSRSNRRLIHLLSDLRYIFAQGRINLISFLIMNTLSLFTNADSEGGIFAIFSLILIKVSESRVYLPSFSNLEALRTFSSISLDISKTLAYPKGNLYSTPSMTRTSRSEEH